MSSSNPSSHLFVVSPSRRLVISSSRLLSRSRVSAAVMVTGASARSHVVYLYFVHGAFRRRKCIVCMLFTRSDFAPLLFVRLIRKLIRYKDYLVVQFVLDYVIINTQLDYLCCLFNLRQWLVSSVQMTSSPSTADRVVVSLTCPGHC